MPVAKHWEQKSSHEVGLYKLSQHLKSSTLKGQEGYSAVDMCQTFNPRQESFCNDIPASSLKQMT